MSQFLHLNMLEALGRLGEGIYRLKGYTELNHAALYKILRKWDKVLKRTDGVAEIYPQIIEGTRIGDMTAIEALDANVKEAFSRQLHRRRAEGRPVSVVVEETDRHELPGCSTEWMDSLLQQRAIEVLFSGVERTEVQEDGQVYLFFPRMDIGPYTSQVRMTCQILQEKANRADVKVLAINPGLMKDGAIEYLKEFEELLEAKTEIQLRWQDDRRGGLRVYQQALQRFKYYMPTWFPIPDSVALLAAGLGTRSAGLQGQALRAERLLFFFLGSSSALVLSIIALICLPEKDPMTFSKNYFLCSFPVFRVCLSAVLVILGLAYVARVCEDNFINHFFILGIDPRCRVSPNFLFTWAMLLSSAWTGNYENWIKLEGL
eukprot:g13661.t1